MAANEDTGGTVSLVPRMDCVYVEEGQKYVDLQAN